MKKRVARPLVAAPLPVQKKREAPIPKNRRLVLLRVD